MIEVTVPGYGEIKLDYIVLDYNGTLAVDGLTLDGVVATLNLLATQLEIHVLTADTFGSAKEALAHVDCHLAILPAGAQDRAKQQYVKKLGADRCVAVGNGRNDRFMLQEAALGVAVMQSEGTAVPAIMAADIVVPNILSVFAMLLNPRHLIATLRS